MLLLGQIAVKSPIPSTSTSTHTALSFFLPTCPSSSSSSKQGL
uniref:Uncharacterized protein n=1 Tax=Anopheles albimanus TaxID=7167 RepID=A0A182FZC5_ANOAL